MDIAFEVARIVSLASFGYFGPACLLSARMVAEFDRYRLARFRVLVGGLQIAGALGLASSYLVASLVVVSAGGLCLLMFLGVLTRVRIRDPFVAMLPALVLMVVNGFLCLRGLAGPG
jgi:hypothetical protein